MIHNSLIAYIDPSSGTILLQAHIAGTLGIVWRITSLFRRKHGALEAANEPVNTSANTSAETSADSGGSQE